MKTPDVTLTLRLSDDQDLTRKLMALCGTSDPESFGRFAAGLLLKSARMMVGLDGDLTVTEAATHLQVHRNTIFNYLRQGLLPNHYYRTNRTVRIPMSDVEALKERRATAS